MPTCIANISSLIQDCNLGELQQKLVASEIVVTEKEKLIVEKEKLIVEKEKIINEAVSYA